MVFTVEAASAEKVERDITELCRALAQLLNQTIPILQPASTPVQMRAEIEVDSSINVDIPPDLKTPLGADTKLIAGREQERLRGVDPIAISASAGSIHVEPQQLRDLASYLLENDATLAEEGPLVLYLRVDQNYPNQGIAAQLRPIGEIESVTGKELGDIDSLHPEVVAESPVAIVQVDDQGRVIVTAPVIAHVEATENEVEMDVKEDGIQSALPHMELSSSDWENLTAIVDYLESNPDVAIVEDSSSGLKASFDDSGLLWLQTSAGRTLLAGLESPVQTDFLESDFQAAANLAQKTVLAMTTCETDISMTRRLELDVEREQ